MIDRDRGPGDGTRSPTVPLTVPSDTGVKQEAAVRTFKLTTSYDGTAYVGWQRQRNGVSVQAVLENALAPVGGGGVVRVTAAGRTDAGVHAQGQVVSCRLETVLDVASLTRAVNARLPSDVRVLEVAEAPAEFHARYWALEKTYAYHVLNAATGDPLAKHLVWHLPQQLDMDAMQAALRLLCGRHDFKGFQASGSRVLTTVRTLTTASVQRRVWNGILGCERQDGRVGGAGWLLTFCFVGDGFLRHMVRNLVGTVVEVGLGRRDLESVKQILVRRDRRHAGATAPACGLVLVAVRYGDGPAPHPSAD